MLFFIYFLGRWLDSFKICTDIGLGQPHQLNMFCDLDPIIKIKSPFTNDNVSLINEILLEQMEGYSSDLHRYTTDLRYI